MDAKTETFYHLAILACNKPLDVATPKNNKYLRELLGKYGSFKTAFDREIGGFSRDIENEMRKADKYLEKLDLEYKVTTHIDLDFPEELKNRNTTSPILYYCGDLNLLNRDCMAVVGTRNPLNEKDFEDARKVLTCLSNRNYVIVSGLASGCDTLGHKHGLEKGTVGVLGTSINKVYPKENKELQEEISQKHLLVSQFPIGLDRFLYYKTEQPLNFAKRNQTTVALANRGVLVLKTGNKGGTQNAIREAVSLNRPLYALRGNFIPENIWVNNFDWENHGLIRKVK
jgi:DNA processing protein